MPSPLLGPPLPARSSQRGTSAWASAWPAACLAHALSLSDPGTDPGSPSNLKGTLLPQPGPHPSPAPSQPGSGSAETRTLTWISSPGSPGLSSECCRQLFGISGQSQFVPVAIWKSKRGDQTFQNGHELFIAPCGINKERCPAGERSHSSPHCSHTHAGTGPTAACGAQGRFPSPPCIYRGPRPARLFQDHSGR